MVLLDLLGQNEWPTLLADPSLDGIDLVQCDDERGLVLPEDAYGLDGLGHQTLPDVDDQDCEVGERTSPGTQCDERVVTRGVDEKQSGDTELLVPDELLAHLVDVVDRNLCGTDVLGDRTGLPGLDGCSPDTVQKFRLSMINVSKYAYNGLPDRHEHHLTVCKKGVW